MFLRSSYRMTDILPIIHYDIFSHNLDNWPKQISYFLWKQVVVLLHVPYVTHAHAIKTCKRCNFFFGGGVVVKNKFFFIILPKNVTFILIK